jgi:hypothetical protein
MFSVSGFFKGNNLIPRSVSFRLSDGDNRYCRDKYTASLSNAGGILCVDRLPMGWQAISKLGAVAG